MENIELETSVGGVPLLDFIDYNRIPLLKQNIVGKEIIDTKRNKHGIINKQSNSMLWVRWKNNSKDSIILLSHANEIERYNIVENISEELEIDLETSPVKTAADGMAGWEAKTATWESELKECGYKDIEVTRIYPHRQEAEWYSDEKIVEFTYRGYSFKGISAGSGVELHVLDGNDYRDIYDMKDLEEYGVVDDETFNQFSREQDELGNQDLFEDNDCMLYWYVKDSNDDICTYSYEEGWDDCFSIDDLLYQLTDKNEIDKMLDRFGAPYENELQEKIVKKGNKYQVQSENGRNMGTYDTKAEAEKRLQQVHYFKHVNEEKVELEITPNKIKIQNEGVEITDTDLKKQIVEYINPYISMFGLPKIRLYDVLNGPIRIWESEGGARLTYYSQARDKYQGIYLSESIADKICDMIGLSNLETFNSLFESKGPSEIDLDASRPIPEPGRTVPYEDQGSDYGFYELSADQCYTLDTLTPGDSFDFPENVYGEMFRRDNDIWVDFFDNDTGNDLGGINNISQDDLDMLGIKLEEIPNSKEVTNEELDLDVINPNFKIRGKEIIIKDKEDKDKIKEELLKDVFKYTAPFYSVDLLRAELESIDTSKEMSLYNNDAYYLYCNYAISGNGDRFNHGLRIGKEGYKTVLNILGLNDDINNITEDIDLEPTTNIKPGVHILTKEEYQKIKDYFDAKPNVVYKPNMSMNKVYTWWFYENVDRYYPSHPIALINNKKVGIGDNGWRVQVMQKNGYKEMGGVNTFIPRSLAKEILGDRINEDVNLDIDSTNSNLDLNNLSKEAKDYIINNLVSAEGRSIYSSYIANKDRSQWFLRRNLEDTNWPWTVIMKGILPGAKLYLTDEQVEELKYAVSKVNEGVMTKDGRDVGPITLKKGVNTKLSLYVNNRLISWVNVSDTGYIYYLETKPEYRGMGLGSILIDKAINDMGGYWLHIERPNIKVQKWYESLGFVLYRPDEKYVRLMVLENRIQDFQKLYDKYNGNLRMMLGNLSGRAYRDLIDYENKPEVRTIYDDEGNILKEEKVELDVDTTNNFKIESLQDNYFYIVRPDSQKAKDILSDILISKQYILDENPDEIYVIFINKTFDDEGVYDIMTKYGHHYYLTKAEVKDYFKQVEEDPVGLLDNDHDDNSTNEELDLETPESVICTSLNKKETHDNGGQERIVWYKTEWEVYDSEKIKTICKFIEDNNNIQGYDRGNQIKDVNKFINKRPFKITLEKSNFGGYSQVWNDEKGRYEIQSKKENNFNFYLWIQLGPHSKSFTVQPIQKDSDKFKLVMDLLKDIDAPRLNEVNLESKETVNESKEDKEKFAKWANDEILVQDFYDNQQRLADKDIYSWMKKEPAELRKAIDDLGNTNSEDRKKAMEGAKLIDENDYWKVYRIDTVEASKLLGKETKWCISGEGKMEAEMPVFASTRGQAISKARKMSHNAIIKDVKMDEDGIYLVTIETCMGDYYFNDYKENEEATYYFLISKPENKECYGDEKLNKIAIKANCYGEVEVFDSQDERMSEYEIPHYDMEKLYNIW